MQIRGLFLHAAAFAALTPLLALAGNMLSSDGDGVPDLYDNCVLVPNGPNLSAPLFGACPLQFDEDGDGYGNACDADINRAAGRPNDGVVNLNDLNEVLLAFGTVNAHVDMTCTGEVDVNDLNHILLHFGGEPGPSGLVCAGVDPGPTDCTD